MPDDHEQVFMIFFSWILNRLAEMTLLRIQEETVKGTP